MLLPISLVQPEPLMPSQRFAARYTKIYGNGIRLRKVFPDIITLPQLSKTTVIFPVASVKSIITVSLAKSAPAASMMRRRGTGS